MTDLINAKTNDPESSSGWTTGYSDDSPEMASAKDRLATGLNKLYPGGDSPLRITIPGPQQPADEAKIGKYEAGIATAQQPYYEKLNKVLSSPQEATAHLEKVKDAPNPEDYHKYSMEFASAAAVLGAVAGRFTRAGGTAALNAFSGALKGWQAGNVQAYEEASKQWEQATKQTIANNNVELQKYHEILDNKKANIEQMMAGLTIASSEYQNKVIFDLAKSGNFGAVAQAVDKMGAANQRLQGAFGQLNGVRNDQWAEADSKIDTLNNDPQLNLQIRQTNPKEWFALAAAGHARGKELNQPPAEPEMSPTLDADAERYRQTGTLPPNMGRGIQGQTQAHSIRQRATELEIAAGGNPSDWPTKWQQFRSRGVGLNREESTLSGRAGNVSIAVDEAERTIPIVRQLAQQNAGKGIAVWNTVDNAWKVQSGDRGFAQYVAQLNSLINIYGRVISGGAAGTVSDKEHARGFLNPNMPLTAVEGSLDAFQTEVGIAQQAPERARTKMRGNQGDGGAQTLPADSSDGWGEVKVH
jgi:hypothetical protein